MLALADIESDLNTLRLSAKLAERERLKLCERD